MTAGLDGELVVLGQIRAASNVTLLCDSGDVRCVYKPVRGEQPLWDFPDGTLAGREVAAYLVSDALGWGVIPETILRDGPYGTGMVQRWITAPDPGSAADLVDVCPPDAIPSGYRAVLRARGEDGQDVMLIHATEPQLYRMAVLDVLLNNADRKGGHVLRGPGGEVFGVDHGICLHTEPKLRTVLWGWAGEPIATELLDDIAGLAKELDSGELGERLRGLITPQEVRALATRAAQLASVTTMPLPDSARPIPWPAF